MARRCVKTSAAAKKNDFRRRHRGESFALLILVEKDLTISLHDKTGAFSIHAVCYIAESAANEGSIGQLAFHSERVVALNIEACRD